MGHLTRTWLFVFVVGLSICCNSSEEKGITDFHIVHEDSSEDFDSSGPALITVCDPAPRDGTLVLSEVVDVQRYIAGNKELCDGEYPYQSTAYR